MLTVELCQQHLTSLTPTTSRRTVSGSEEGGETEPEARISTSRGGTKQQKQKTCKIGTSTAAQEVPNLREGHVVFLRRRRRLIRWMQWNVKNKLKRRTSHPLELFQKLLFIVQKQKQKQNTGKGDSLASTAEKIHTDVARVTLQRVHGDGIKLPVQPTSDEVSVTWEEDDKNWLIFVTVILITGLP